MLFADIDLARRIERAECRLVGDCVRAAQIRPESGDLFALPLAGGVATYGGAESPLNKVVGLGFDGPVNDEALEAIERRYLALGVAVQVELSTLADPSVAAQLTSRGYILRGFENVLGRALQRGEGRRPANDIEVVQDTGDLRAWLDAIVEGFAAPDTRGVASDESYPIDVIERVIGDMARAEGFTRYLARREGVTAGGASMRIFDGVASLCGAATRPAHRRRGVQRVLLEARLADAADAGCDVAVVTTQPGSTSQQNAQRQGFGLLFCRAVLGLEPTVDTG